MTGINYLGVRLGGAVQVFLTTIKITSVAIVIAVAWYGVQAAGGMHSLLGTLEAQRAAAGPGAGDITAMLPDFSRGFTTVCNGFSEFRC